MWLYYEFLKQNFVGLYNGTLSVELWMYFGMGTEHMSRPINCQVQRKTYITALEQNLRGRHSVIKPTI
jgi:hypothetical protein